MRARLEWFRSRRRLTWLLSGLTFPSMTAYNLLIPRFNIALSIVFALGSAIFVYAFFWYVLRATSLPD